MIHTEILARETTIDYGATLTRAATESTLATLTDGLYNVTFIGKATYTYTVTEPVINGNGEEENVEVTKTAEANIQGSQQNVEVKGGSVSLNLTIMQSIIQKRSLLHWI